MQLDFGQTQIISGMGFHWRWACSFRRCFWESHRSKFVLQIKLNAPRYIKLEDNLNSCGRWFWESHINQNLCQAQIKLATSIIWKKIQWKKDLKIGNCEARWRNLEKQLSGKNKWWRRWDKWSEHSAALGLTCTHCEVLGFWEFYWWHCGPNSLIISYASSLSR
jgi:hypothetical protein